MSNGSYFLAAAVFLGLYPFSIVLNAAHGRLRHPFVRFLLLLTWPLAGVLLLSLAEEAVPRWFVAWGLLSSAFYALRLLTVRDLGRYASIQASSVLALTWGLAANGVGVIPLSLFVLAMMFPVALMSLLDGLLTRRFGAAYAGLCPGLGSATPRLAGLLVLATLAAIGTPPFPGFFALLDLFNQLQGLELLGVLAIWLVWGWSAARLLQGFVAGECRQEGVADLELGNLRIWVGALVAFMLAGFYFAGGGV